LISRSTSDSVWTRLTRPWFSEFYGFRVWGQLRAVVGYLFAALHTVVFLVLRRPSSRWVPVGFVLTLSVLVPMFSVGGQADDRPRLGSRRPR